MRGLVRWGAAAVAAVALTVACGGDGDGGNGPGGGGGGSGDFAAKIDGASWASDAARVQVLAGSTGVPGSLIITGTKVNGTSAVSITFALGFVRFAGNYPLGVNYISTPGGTATIVEQSGGTVESRTTPLDGESGVFQVVSNTNGHIKGVFSFVAQPVLGATYTGNREITEGTFDFELPGDFTDVGAPNYGSSIQASFNGDSFNGATILGTVASGFYIIGAQTTKLSLSISTQTAVSSATTLSLGAGARVTVLDLTNGHSWGGIAGDSGTVQFSGASGGRANGTFGGRLAPNTGSGASGNLVITGGSFNVRADPAP